MDIERAKKMNTMIKELSQHRSVFGGHDDCVDYVKKMYGDLSPSLVLEDEHPAPAAYKEEYQGDYATLSLVDRKLRFALSEQQQLFEAALMKLGEQLTEFISQHQTEVAELKKLVAAAPFSRSSAVEQEIKRELRQVSPKEPTIAAQVAVQERLEQPIKELIEQPMAQIPRPEAPKQFAPRTGSFTPADVSVEKFFYCGTK